MTEYLLAFCQCSKQDLEFQLIISILKSEFFKIHASKILPKPFYFKNLIQNRNQYLLIEIISFFFTVQVLYRIYCKFKFIHFIVQLYSHYFALCFVFKWISIKKINQCVVNKNALLYVLFIPMTVLYEVYHNPYTF